MRLFVAPTFVIAVCVTHAGCTAKHASIRADSTASSASGGAGLLASERDAADGEPLAQRGPRSDGTALAHPSTPTVSSATEDVAGTTDAGQSAASNARTSEDVAPMEITPEMIAKYAAARKDPDVHTIRTFLTRLHQGQTSKTPQDLPGLEDLEKIPAAETKGQFILLSVDGYLLGGALYAVMFRAPPNRIVRFWPRYGEVRQIIVEDRPPEVHEQLVRYYRHALDEPALGL